MKLPFARRSVAIVSPLRYPGAKRRLSAYIAEALGLNSLRPKLFVEPFAGGASVALELLQRGLVETVALGEKDPLVASFWQVVFHDPEWLIERLETVDVTVANWKYFKHTRFRSTRDKALACIFLNRTSFSGILAGTAGPIGGQSQSSEYSIDCRFAVSTIAKRIRQAAALAKKILFVNNDDWESTIRKAEAMRRHPKEVFYYFDPPFYKKAERLYTCYFTVDDHKRLRNQVIKLRQPWLLSYDPAQEIVELYSQNDRGPRHVELLYSASARADQIKGRELIISNLARLPARTRLWRSSSEWKRENPRRKPPYRSIDRGK